MPLTRELADSVVVVTGGSGGIGAATALRLARRRPTSSARSGRSCGSPATSGGVFAPGDDVESAVDGGWHHRRWTAARLAALGAAGAGLAFAGWRRARRW